MISGKIPKIDWLSILIFLAGYAAGYWFAGAGKFILSGVCLIVMALFVGGRFLLNSGWLLDMRVVFTLFWLGGVGVSALKLSNLATEWTWQTWVSFGLTWVCFMAAYELTAVIGRSLLGAMRKKSGAGSEEAHQAVRSLLKRTAEYAIKSPDTDEAKRLLVLIAGTTFISAACFVFEAVTLQLIPLFSDLPHAYSEFHISGVHYFTVTAVLVPALCVLYGRGRAFKGSLMDIIMVVCLAISIAIPILAVSRFQLIFAVALAVVVWLSCRGRLSVKLVLVLGVIMLTLYVGLTFARHHDVAYLNGIFEMKNPATPIFVTQPYMYIANNYDNFNCLTMQLPAHTHGLRMAFPAFVFTGMKFSHPELVSFPIYITKTELTTLTLIYDAYYDFGIAGVACFSLVLGVVCRLIAWFRNRSQNPIRHLLYGQALLYLALSFFTTWYSNPTTWFWYGVSVIYLIVMAVRRKSKK